MRKGRDGGRKKTGKIKGEKTDDYSGHYIIASRRPAECRPLVPISCDGAKSMSLSEH